MPDILSINEFSDVFTASSRATPEEINWALDGGLDELIELVGDEAVTDAQAVTPTDTVRASRLKRGLGHLAYSILVVNVASRLREAGILKKESDGVAGNTVNEYLPPKDVQVISDQQRALGLAAISKYLVSEQPGDEFADGAEYSHPAQTEVCAL